MRILLLVLVPTLSGCAVSSVANAAVDLATLPVKVVSAGVDAATTSQSEADEKRGRQIRQEEERLGRERRRMEERCRKGRAQADDDCSGVPPR